MRIKCTFCGKMLLSQRGLQSHLRTCKPVSRGKRTIDKRSIPEVILLPSSSYNDLSHQNIDSNESSISLEDMDEEISDQWMEGPSDDVSSQMIDEGLCDKELYLTPKERIELKLLKFCEKIQAPLYAYDLLMETLGSCKITDKTFTAEFTRRSAMMEKLKKETGMKLCEPQSTTVKLESGKTVTVITCPFVPTLKSLLNDPRCMKDSNLTFPNNDPYSSPIETGKRDELHSGTWYRNTWNSKCTEKGDYILALYLFIDKTFTDVYGRLNFEPVQFTLSMFNRKTRNRYYAWRPMGYINDLKLIQDYEEDDRETNVNNQIPKLKISEVNIRDYHRILEVILKDFREVQERGKLKMNLHYRNNTYALKLIPVLGPIIGDTSGHDMLVGRYGGRTNVDRICRYCDCHYENSDDPEVDFQYTFEKDINGLYEENNNLSKTKLKEISYHYVKNAFHSIDKGSDERGIHGLCPVELLHCMRLGILKIAAECFAQLLTPSILEKFDKLLQIISKQLKHQSYRGMARTSFTGSIMNFKRKTADEWSGIIFLLTTGLITEAGKQIWRNLGLPDATKNAFIKIFEKCLVVEKWMQKEDGYMLGNLQRARIIMIEFMKEYKKTCSRQVGNKMKLVKFHMLLHIVDDIERIGSPQNTNGGPCEANFKPQKKESGRTQRRAAIFHEQMAKRIYEQNVINRAICEEERSVESEMSDRLVTGSKFQIKYNDSDMNYELIWNRPTQKKQIYEEAVIEFVHGIFFKNTTTSEIHCFTEHRINNVIFHGDCSYRGESEWYDWAQVLWNDPDDENNTITVLGQIKMFVDCRNHKFGQIKNVNGIDIAGEEIYAVISSLTWREPRDIGVSMIFQKGNLEIHNEEKTYYAVPIAALNGTALAINNIQDGTLDLMDDEVIIIKPCDEWGSMYDTMY